MAPDDRLKEIEGHVADLREAVVEHRVRLENGVKVFAAQDRKIEALQARTRPRPPSILKIASLSFGIFCTLAGALWYLSWMLSSRPTTEQVHQIFTVHERTGHPEIREQLTEVQKDVAAQSAVIKDVRADQTDTIKKIDELLRRAPRRKGQR